ncbi:MAG: alkaline phosphatase D family protein [Chloroflexi bacterium]|nr:alkaline phosphatase D family protein [Chloroflexota bacterium]
MRNKNFWLITLLVVLLLAGGAAAQDANTLPNGVAAGDVTPTTAVLWARSTTMSVTFEVATDPEFATIITTGSGSGPAAMPPGLAPLKLEVTGLTPGTQYYYRATDFDGATAVGTFRTPAEVGERRGLRFGVTGDWRGEMAPYPAVSNVAEMGLDFFMLHGDTIYADYPSPDVPLGQAITFEDFYRKHAEVYGERYGLNTWADVRASTAIFATIDDHEVTNDFAGGAAPETDPRFTPGDAEFINDTELYETGLSAFQDYNPLRDEFYGDTGDPRTAQERKLYRYRTFGSDAALFILDARSFRDPALPNVEEFTMEQIGPFLAATFEPGRTMLGAAQLADLKADLLDAQTQGILWKFVMVPEPIQNLGPLNAGDRFEGYAAERTELLKFIVDNQIANVVFVTADIHGTLVNNITYQDAPGGVQIATGTFEISVGSAAFDAPFGPTVVALAAGLDFITPQQRALYNVAPPVLKESFIAELVNGQIEPLGYDPLGLEGADIQAELVSGGYLVTGSYGWTLFEIDAETQQLRVVTYGIPYYTQSELVADPEKYITLEPAILSEFVVTPK